MNRLLPLIAAFALAACNSDRAGNGNASSISDDTAPGAADADVALDVMADVSDAAEDVAPDVVDAPEEPDSGGDAVDAGPSGCDLTGLELDCSDPQWTGLNMGSPCEGELLYNGTREPIPYGTRENSGLMAYEDGILATLGVDPPTGTLCRLELDCDEEVKLLTGFEGPTQGAAFVQVGEVTYAFPTRWGAHRSMPAVRVETGPLDRAWSAGDATSWILLGERDGQVRLWQDVSAGTSGVPADPVGTPVGAGSQFTGVGSHRYFMLGNAFDGVLGHGLMTSESWEGPAQRAWPVSGHSEFVAVMQSAIDDQLVLLGSEQVPVGLTFEESDQLVVAGSFGQVAFARRRLDGQVEFAIFDPEAGVGPQWEHFTDLLPAGPIEGGLFSMHVSEDDGASKFSVSYGFYGPHAFEINVARPQDPRCD